MRVSWSDQDLEADLSIEMGHSASQCRRAISCAESIVDERDLLLSGLSMTERPRSRSNTDDIRIDPTVICWTRRANE